MHDEGPLRFAAALGELEAELDWDRLGRLYCHEGGEAFFAPAQLAAQTEAGLMIASGLAEALGDVSGRSLYVGAALGELAPILCEVLVLGREVVILNLPGPEVDELNRALAAVADRLDLSLPRIVTDGIEAVDGTFDHLWLASVLTDPDAFPALHDHLYRRKGPQATRRGDRASEERTARTLTAGWVERLTTPGLVTTTDEELEFVREACRGRDLLVKVPDEGRLSAIVGDVLRHCRVRSAV